MMLGALAAPLAAAAAEPPVVAVFSVEDARADGTQLAQHSLAALTEYLASRLSRDGKLRVVPDADIRRALADRKAASYAPCIDATCQIEVGRELAAQKSIATRVVELGGNCIVILTIYDLRTATADRSFDEEGACSVEAIQDALKRIAAQLQSARDVGDKLSPTVPRLSDGDRRASVRLSESPEPIGHRPVTDSILVPDDTEEPENAVTSSWVFWLVLGMVAAAGTVAAVYVATESSNTVCIGVTGPCED